MNSSAHRVTRRLGRVASIGFAQAQCLDFRGLAIVVELGAWTIVAAQSDYFRVLGARKPGNLLAFYKYFLDRTCQSR